MHDHKFLYQTDGLYVGQCFPTKSALFAAVTGKKPPSSGSRNIAYAYNNLSRYVEFQKCCEVDPSCLSKRSVIVTAIYDPPRPQDDKRGSHGTYIEDWSSLLVEQISFSGSFYQLMYRSGVFSGMFDNLAPEKFMRDTQDLSLYRTVNGPWISDSNTPSAAKEYGQLLRKQLKTTVERALNSLAKKGVIVFEKYYQLSCTHPVNYLECLEVIKIEAQRPGSCLDFDLVSSLVEAVASNMGPDSKFFPRSVKATDTQREAIENYKCYLRQCVYGAYIGSDTLREADTDWISKEGKFFSSPTLASMYFRLDEEKKEKLLGGIWFWRKYQYHVVDSNAVATYSSEDHTQVAARLTGKLINYMDVQMCKHEILVHKEDMPDLSADSFIGEIRCDMKLPLKCFKSAREIHSRIQNCI